MSPIIRPATFDDYADVTELMQRYRLETRPFEEWKHQWEGNPALANRADPWPLGWSLENNKKLVGFIGNIPSSCSFDGRRWLVTTASAWVVDEPYRAQSIGLVKRYFGQADVDLFLNTTARVGSGKVFEALGAKRMPLSSYEQALFWVTAPREVMRGLLLKKNVPGAAALSLPLGLALGTVLSIRWMRTRKGDDVREVAGFDGGFDEFWSELKQRSAKLLSWRDAETLNWHFKYALAARRARILTLEARGRIIAYAVLYRQDNAALALKRYRLADFQCLADNETERAFGALLSRSLDLCRNERVHLLEIVGFAPEKRAIFEKFAPLKRKLETWPYYFKSRHGNMAAALSAPAAWDPSIYDGDGSL